jgi:hypothetical protein
MRWEEERYVRVYTREEPEWTLLPFESRLLWCDLMKRFDRAGLLPLGRSRWRGVASICRVPLDFVERAMPALLGDGCCRLVPDDKGGEMLFAPNYMVAQEATQSDAARQRASRERARDRARANELGLVSQNVTDPPDFEVSQNVTEASRDVTDPSRNDPDPSRAVTRCHSVPSLTVLNQEQTNGAFAPSGPGGPGTSSTTAEGTHDEASRPTLESNRPAPPSAGQARPTQQATQLALVAPEAKPKTPSQADLVFARYEQGWRRLIEGGRAPVLSEARRRLIARRLKDGLSLEVLLAAADGVWRSRWHVENNRYQFDLVFRDVEHVERFANQAHEVLPGAGSRGRHDVQRGSADHAAWAETSERLHGRDDGRKDTF